MISLKKYLDMKLDPSRGNAIPRELLEAAIASYRSALLEMGKSGYQACPAFGAGLQTQLVRVEKRLATECTHASLRETGREVTEQLSQFGEKTSEHMKGKAQEVKDLLMMLARTAESLGERDHRYAGHLNQFTARLRAVADLEELTEVRSSLMQTANELKSYVDQMEEDSQKSIASLQSKLSNYESKLKETEELALRDTLTGLPNRLQFERSVEWKMENGQTFCVAIVDLNRFKQVNDRFGHTAGDELLKQFAQELRSNLRPVDLVARWGGDEFVVILDCGLEAANDLLERVRKWVFGDYTLGEERDTKIRVRVTASIGVAEWVHGESMQQMLDRADEVMYLEKARRHEEAGEGKPSKVALAGR